MLRGAQIRSLLTELGETLAARGVRGELFVVGGAAMALAYNTRRATRDVDGVFEPKAVVYEAARDIAASHPDLPADWLNDAVKGFLLGADPNATVALDHPGLRVLVASPRYPFALKVAAARVEVDADDIAALFGLCGYRSADEALDDVAAAFPALRLQPKAVYLLESIAAGGDPPG